MGEILNCTPHAITVVDGEKKVVIPPSGITVRIATEEKFAGEVEINGTQVPLVKQELKELVVLKDGKPLSAEEVANTFENVEGLIVPLVVAQHKEELERVVGKPLKVYAPNTARAVRDGAGKIIGVPSLVVF